MRAQGYQRAFVVPFHSATIAWCRSIRQPFFLQQVAALLVFDFQNPKIRVELPLARDGRIHFGLVALGQTDPGALSAQEVERALKSLRPPVQAVQFHQDGPGGIIPMMQHKGGNIRQPEARKIGRDPKIRR